MYEGMWMPAINQPLVFITYLNNCRFLIYAKVKEKSTQKANGYVISVHNVKKGSLDKPTTFWTNESWWLC